LHPTCVPALVFTPLVASIVATVNLCHARRALSALDHNLRLRYALTAVRGEGLRQLEAMQHEDKALVSLLFARRNFIDLEPINRCVEGSNCESGAAPSSWRLCFDPRMLSAEFTLCSPLRVQQVALVRSMVDSIDRGTSGIFQMQMGAGKTTVVSPLWR